MYDEIKFTKNLILIYLSHFCMSWQNWAYEVFGIQWLSEPIYKIFNFSLRCSTFRVDTTTISWSIVWNIKIKKFPKSSFP